MDLTLSIPILAAHKERGQLLWYAPDPDGDSVYWSVAAQNTDDALIATPDDLLVLAPTSGDRTLDLDVLTWSDDDDWAAQVWCSEADLVIVNGYSHFSSALLFGPLHPGGLRHRVGAVWNGDSLACLPGGLWHCVRSDLAPAIATNWRGAVGMTM